MGEAIATWGWYLRNNTHGSDVLNLAIVLLFTFLIRPWTRKSTFFAAGRVGWLLVPLLFGLLVGFFAEYARSLPQGGNFFPSVGLRRAMAAGCGAAVVMLFARVFFYSADSGYRTDPTPRR